MAIVDDLARAFDRWSLHRGKLVVAVSGGADSIALLHAVLAARQPDLIVSCAHVNHELRPGDAEHDARFVEQHARETSVEFLIATARPDPELIRRRGIEAAARSARYAALHELRRAAGADWIATGHTMDDQAETVLLRLLSHSPVETLQSIRPMTPDGVIRPLLESRRSDVHGWLRSQQIEHRFDVSNDDLRFMRNRIRHLLLPNLEAADEHAVPRLASIADHVRAIQDVIEPLRDRLSQAWTRAPERSSIAESDLPRSPSLRRMTFLDELRRLVPDGREVSGERLASLAEELHASPRVSLGDGIDAIFHQGRIHLETEGESTEFPAFEWTIASGQTVTIPEIGARVTIRRVAAYDRLTDEARTFQLFSLPDGTRDPSFTIRNRRPGDRFHPLGMEGTRKLKDLLIDRGVPREDRDRLPLLVYRDEIVWVAGVELSDRFRIRPGRDPFEVRIDYGPSTTSEIV